MTKGGAVALGAATPLPVLDHHAHVCEVAQAVRVHGGVVLRQLADEALMRAADDELSPHFATTPHSRGTFTGHSTRRTSRLVAKSAACRELVMHPLVLGVADELFRADCYGFQLSNTLATRVDPGAPPQSLHRDDNVYPFRHPSPATVLAAIWALDDFTERNGSTRVVAGSHLWDDARRPSPGEGRSVVMPRGSLLLYDGALFHGAGGNRTDASRRACIFGYTLGWLRQLENQFLAVPPALARTLPRNLQRLLGYQNHGFLGSFEEQDPIVVLEDEIPDALASHDLFTAELEARALRRR